MREWRELSAGRLLAIRREVLRETEDALERDLLCNAAVLAESLTEDGERVYPDGEAVLGTLSCREMEERMLRDFTLQERENFSDYLARAYRNLKEERRVDGERL